MNDEAQAAFGAPASSPSAPGRAGYWVGGGLMVAGVVAAVLWVVLGFVRFANAVDDLARVPVPGGGEVTLTEGKKAIYYEASFAQERTPSMQITIRAVDGPTVEVGEHSGSVSYSLSGHTGQSVASARIPRDGRYVVSVTGGFGDGTDQELAIGKGVGSRIVGIIVGAFVVLIGFAVAGAVCLIVTSSRRTKARQAAAAAA